MPLSKRSDSVNLFTVVVNAVVYEQLRLSLQPLLQYRLYCKVFTVVVYDKILRLARL